MAPAKLTAEVLAASDASPISRYSEALSALRRLYSDLPQLREQIRGRERIFLASHLRTLGRFKSFMDSCDAQGVFYPEPVWVAQMALALAHRVDPVAYARIEDGITSIRFSEEQKIAEVASLINLVIPTLAEFVADKDMAALDQILAADNDGHR